MLKSNCTHELIILRLLSLSTGEAFRFPVVSTCRSIDDSMIDPEKTPIKSEDNDEMNHILEFLHSEHDCDLLEIDLNMIQPRMIVSP